MKKYEAVRHAEDCVTLLSDRKEGGWGFRFRETPESPWQTSPSYPRVEALQVRRVHLIRHARRLLGKPEEYEEKKKDWTSHL
jgi:hypothetical protein